MKKHKLLAGPFQRINGLVGAFIFGGLALYGILSEYLGGEEPSLRAESLALAFLSIAFSASARFAILALVQPIACLAMCPIHAFGPSEYPFGLISAFYGAFLLCRMGFFTQGRTRRAVVLALGVIGIEIAIHIALYRSIPSIILVLIYCGIFALSLLALVRWSEGCGFASRKPGLCLASCGLTELDRKRVGQFLAGMEIKEIASEEDRSSSTIRNGLRKAYHKLGIERVEELITLGERYDIDYGGKSCKPIGRWRKWKKKRDGLGQRDRRHGEDGRFLRGTPKKNPRDPPKSSQ